LKLNHDSLSLWSKSRVADVIPTAVSLLLLFAAGSKCHQLSTSLLPEADLWTSRWLLILVVEVEIGLGIWLATRLYAQAARAASLFLFYSLAVTSLYLGTNGVKYCPCFGDVVRISPWITAAVDGMVVLGLLWWQPQSIHTGSTYRRAIFSFGFFLLLGLPALPEMIKGAHYQGVSIELHKDSRLLQAIGSDLDQASVSQLLRFVQEETGVRLANETKSTISNEVRSWKFGQVPAFHIVEAIGQEIEPGAHWHPDGRGGYRLVSPPFVERWRPEGVFAVVLSLMTFVGFIFLSWQKLTRRRLG
jgi:hypothetical protein